MVHQYPPHFIGGTEFYTQAVAVAQVESGLDVAVFVPVPWTEAPDMDSLKPVVEKGVRVYRAPVGERSRTKVFIHSFRQPQLQRYWQMVLDAEQPDLVHIEHLMGLPLSVVDDLRKRGIPFLVTLHDYWFVCANAQLLTNTNQEICRGPDSYALNCARCALARGGFDSALGLAPTLAPIMKHRNNQTAAVLKDANRIIAPTHFVCDIYLSLLPDVKEIDVLAHGIDAPNRSVANAQRDQRVNRKDGRLQVGYIGSVARQKGVHVLVSAVNGLSEEDIALTIYGDLKSSPEYVAELQRMITRPGIEMRGVLDRDAIWSAITGFDVVIIPTLWYETSVLVIDEVFAMGVPVIGSDIGVLQEKIKDGENGRLFTPGDVKGLQDILAELVKSPGILSIWRQNIEPVFSIGDHISMLEEIYGDVVNPV
ncbi:MAG: glycosyltransferase [Candidatus Promineifilaceae bacterium]|jgi:glycosyltransferase involved in cell wall biosynthesis